MDPEIRTLLSFLHGQRRHVLGILDGLDMDALRQPVLPSGWNCLGLVQHLALDGERFWFRAVVVGEEDVIKSLGDDGDAWQVGPEVQAAEILDRYRTETDLADTIISATAADALLAWWPHQLFGEPYPGEGNSIGIDGRPRQPGRSELVIDSGGVPPEREGQDNGAIMPKSRGFDPQVSGALDLLS
ncbi:DUF664 domain-containing protein [Streptomyces sp. NPDC056949]|uniref:mycothiol transferase n=1 Tax=Streptomyces sp. NPDC056949 TaxID=3345976 RepID=UPI00363520E8